MTRYTLNLIEITDNAEAYVISSYHFSDKPNKSTIDKLAEQAQAPRYELICYKGQEYGYPTVYAEDVREVNVWEEEMLFKGKLFIDGVISSYEVSGSFEGQDFFMIYTENTETGEEAYCYCEGIEDTDELEYLVLVIYDFFCCHEDKFFAVMDLD